MDIHHDERRQQQQRSRRRRKKILFSLLPSHSPRQQVLRLAIALFMTIVASLRPAANRVFSLTVKQYIQARRTTATRNTKRTMTSSSVITPAEITLQCSDGIHLAGQCWKDDDAINSVGGKEKKHHRILCLHGWMDNAASFHSLAPAIIQHFSSPAPSACRRDGNEGDGNRDIGSGSIELVALDFVGHGQSAHKSMDGAQNILAEHVYYVAEAVQQLKWLSPAEDASPGFILIGHSMGAAVGCLYASAFPEQVKSLVLLEGSGPLARNPSDAAKHVRNHVRRRLIRNEQTNNNKQSRIYPSLEKAIEVRRDTARNMPGNQSLSQEAAEKIVSRGSKQIPVNQESNQGIQFCHDPRLHLPSLQYFTQEQTNALYKDISCPTALFLAEDGWPSEEEKLQSQMDLLKPATFARLPGSHHFHLDPESAEIVSNRVIQFLETFLS